MKNIPLFFHSGFSSYPVAAISKIVTCSCFFLLGSALNSNGAGFQSALKETLFEVNLVSVENVGANNYYLRAHHGGNGYGNGDNVELRSWENWEAQKWHLERQSGTQYALKLKGESRYLRGNAGGDGWQDYDNVEIHSWNNWGTQKWNLHFGQHGRTRFEMSGSSLNLKAWTGGDGWQNGDNVVLKSWTGNNSMLWDIEMLETLGSPSIAEAPNGSLVAYMKHNRYSGNSKGYVFRSENRGSSWSKVWETDTAIYGPTLFSHGGALYMIFCYGNSLCIKKSTNNGSTWSERETLYDLGVGTESGGGAPVLVSGGYIYYGFMDTAGGGGWPSYFRLRVSSCSVNDDLMVPTNWKVTSARSFPESPAVDDADLRGGWLEPNLVERPDGKVALFARIDSRDKLITACMQVSNNRDSIAFNNAYPVTGFEKGFQVADWSGTTKFHIQFDDVTDRYWIMSCPQNGPLCSLSASKAVELPVEDRWIDRNQVALYSTTDFVTVNFEEMLIEDDLISDAQDSVDMTGFQQPTFVFDGNKIKYLLRTAYGTFDVYHEANKITYHEYQYR